MAIHLQAKQWVQIAEFILYNVGVSALLQVAAGFTSFWQAGILGLVCLACILPMFLYFVEHPDLFKRRINFGPEAEHTTSQRIIVSLLLLLYAALNVIAGLDHRFGWSHVPILVVVVGNLLFAGGLLLILLVFQANPYAAASVNVETEQTVIASGLYARIRHPMYSALLALFLGIPLALGSWWALATFLPLLAVVIWRLLDEERYLSTHLAGYQEYQAKVTYRLIPALW